MRQLLLVTCAVFVLTGCTTSSYSRATSTDSAVQHAQEVAQVDHFSMAPARLEKGHIFMRRTEDWESVRRQMAEAEVQKAAEEELKKRQAALQRGEIREYIQADGTIVRKEGIAGYEYEQQIDFLPASEWIELSKARVAIHVENKPFEDVLQDTLREVLPYTGPWRLQWKISRENQDLLAERFSLNAETSFEKFVAHVTNFMMNHRGIELVFEQFDKDRILVVSDKY